MRSTRIPPATAVLVAVAVVLAVPPAPASAQALDDPFAGGDYTFSTTDFGGEDPFALEATTSAPVEPFTFGATATDDLLDLSGTIEFGTTPAGTADLFAPAPSLSFPWDGGATASPAPAVQAGALQAEMQRWQRDLQADGVIAHSAAEVFNNHQQELSSRFGLSAQQATEALGGSYSNRVGQRITGPAIVGPAIVGPAIVGPKIVGPAIVGPGIVGEGIVGPCLDASCPNWGASTASPPPRRRRRRSPRAGRRRCGTRPRCGRLRVGRGCSPRRPRRRRRRRCAGPSTTPSPHPAPAAAAAAAELGAAGGPGGGDVLTYPHPLDPRPRRLA